MTETSSARDGGGSHDQNVGEAPSPLPRGSAIKRRSGDTGVLPQRGSGEGASFFPKLRPLCYAKAVLLVDDDKAEVAELHVVLDDGVRAYQDIDAPVQQSRLDCGSLPSLDVSR